VSQPLRIAFLGCGFITRVHSRNLRRFRHEIVCGYASRDKAKAAAVCSEFRGSGSYSDYTDAINDPNVDAVVIAVPPRFHLNLTLQALSAGKHVLVEKPAYPAMGDYEAVRDARDRSWCWSAKTTTTSRWPSRSESCSPTESSATWSSATSAASSSG
jgi:predicted dehydrogenase